MALSAFSGDDVVNAAGVAGADGIADSIQAILYSEPATVNSITSVANFFREGALSTGVERVINIQREAGTTDFRIFVDVNRDGNYTQSDDLVFDIRNPQFNSGTAMVVGDATTATTFFNDANADGVPDVLGVSANAFVFNDAQYKLWADVTSGPIPTATLTPTVPAVNEGASVTFNLATTGLAAGTVLNYALSGTGITVADTTVPLTGTLTVDATGAASLTVTPTADLTTEGTEPLTMSVTGAVAATSNVTINDTSLTPGSFTVVDLSTGTVAATAAAEAFTYDFSMVGGRATKAGDGEVTITGFDVTQDKLVFNDVGTGTVLTEAQFMALAGVSIAENPFALPPPGNTTIYFDPLAGVLGGVTLAGITDAALATIVVETLA